jgi:hypothetical protein
MVVSQEHVVELVFLDFHYDYRSSLVYFMFSSCPLIVVEKHIELHSPQIFESEGRWMRVNLNQYWVQEQND